MDRDELPSLLERVAAGDRDAFARLYTQSAPRLYGLLLRLLGRAALADEALQESFLRIWRHAKRYRPERSEPMTWMTSVARNHALDLLRRQGRRDDLELSWNSRDEELWPDELSRAADVQLGEQQVLDSCLEQLSMDQRECVLRAYCEGYSHEELSERLSTPLGTVKSWIRRGLESLRRCVSEHG